jgi:hypothetical protein
MIIILIQYSLRLLLIPFNFFQYVEQETTVEAVLFKTVAITLL